jgi:hypothetical protein
MQQDVVDIVAGWLHGGPEAAGFMTTGGTESILLAVMAARERGRAERGVERPNVVLPASAHAAFEKAAHYFGLESRRIPVRADWRADVGAMGAAIDDSTVLVVASAPQYPQGVIDPVAEVAALAAERDISCHVDACMGGVTLPYLARLGQSVPPFDFAIDGVTSMSVDLHKFGYTAKGASVIVHRTRALRRYQVFVTERWLGGTYGSSGLLAPSRAAPSLRPGPSCTTGRRRLPAPDADRPRRHRGPRRGHQRPAGARAASAAGERCCWPSARRSRALDVYAVAGALWRRGWYVDRQGPRRRSTARSNAVHEHRIPELLLDRAALDEVLTAGARATAGPTGPSNEPLVDFGPCSARPRSRSRPSPRRRKSAPTASSSWPPRSGSGRGSATTRAPPGTSRSGTRSGSTTSGSTRSASTSG